MAIRIGIYDFFAYTVPGGLLMLLGFGGLYFWGVQEVWTAVRALNTLEVFLLIIGAYLVGLIMEPVFVKWSDLFEKQDYRAELFERMQKRYPDLSISINHNEWAIWFASIRRESLDLALEIDRWMAIGKMLRGVSGVLALAGMLCLANIIGGKISAWGLLTALVFWVLSVLSIRQALRFRASFFLIIFETVISRQAPFTLGSKSGTDKPANIVKKEE